MKSGEPCLPPVEQNKKQNVMGKLPLSIQSEQTASDLGYIYILVIKQKLLSTVERLSMRATTESA